MMRIFKLNTLEIIFNCVESFEENQCVVNICYTLTLTQMKIIWCESFEENQCVVKYLLHTNSFFNENNLIFDEKNSVG
jgi:hypothetical protein